MSDFYDRYRDGFGLLGLTPDCVDAACEELLRVGEPREAIQILRSFDMLPEPLRSDSRRSLIWLLRFVPKPTPVDNAADNAADNEYLPMGDPVWDEPSMALFRDGDPKPLAGLLLQKLPTTPEVSHMLGRMLLPSSGYRGFELKVNFDGRDPFWTDAAQKLSEKRNVARRYEELMSQNPQPPRKNVIADLGREFGRSRAWVEAAIKTDDYQVVLQCEKLLGNLREEEN